MPRKCQYELMNEKSFINSLFLDKDCEKLWMYLNQVSIHFYVFDIKHPHSLFGSHGLKVLSNG